MAIVLVGSNLNTWGNNGNFETDPSTWSGADPYYADLSGTYPSLSRSGTYKTLGNYSARAVYPTSLFTSGTIDGSIVKSKGSSPYDSSKKYLARVKIRTDSVNPYGSDDMKIVWDTSEFPGGISILSQTEALIGDIKSAFTQIEIRFTNVSGSHILKLKEEDGGHVLFAVAYLWVDEFEIYEYVDTEDPEPPAPDPDFDNVFFHKNPIVYPMSAPVGWEAINNLRMYVDVRVQNESGSGVFTSALKQRLYPASNGSLNFYIRQAFREIMDPANIIPPTLNEAEIVKLTDRVKFFKLFTGQVQDSEVTPGDLDESLAYIVLWGGINKYHFPGLNFFGTYIPVNKKFMSWAPLEKEVDRLQEDFINFWVYNSDIVSLQLQCKAYYDDGTDETEVIKTKDGVLYGELYQIPTGAANSGVADIDPTKTLTKYELTLLDGDDNVISETRTYKVALVRHPLTRFFMFLDSLGTYTVLKFTGQAEEETTYSREMVQRYLAHDYESLKGELAVNNATLQDKTNFSSGYLKGQYSEAWKEYLKDFLLSPRVFDVTTGSRIPVIPVAENLPGKADQEYIRFMRFDAQYPFIDDSFTPKTI